MKKIPLLVTLDKEVYENLRRLKFRMKIEEPSAKITYNEVVKKLLENSNREQKQR